MENKDLLIEKLLAEIMQLKAMLAEQAADIAALKKRLGKDSNNSSKPPSSDRLSKPPRTNTLREKGKNKSGGQTGHKGETLKQREVPDQVMLHSLITN